MTVKSFSFYPLTIRNSEKGAQVTSLTLSVEEAAVMLGCSAEHVRRQIRRGILPKVEGIGRKVKISREVIYRAISGQPFGAR